MYISGVKFEERCFNISRDIFIPYCTILVAKRRHEVITFLICIIQKRQYLQNNKKINSKGKHYVSVFWKAFQISNNYFSFHKYFNRERRISQLTDGNF